MENLAVSNELRLPSHLQRCSRMPGQGAGKHHHPPSRLQPSSLQFCVVLHPPLPHGAAHPAVTWLEAPFSSPLCWPELRDCHSAVRAARRLKGSSEHDDGVIMLIARCHCLLSSAGGVPDTAQFFSCISDTH